VGAEVDLDFAAHEEYPSFKTEKPACKIESTKQKNFGEDRTFLGIVTRIAWSWNCKNASKGPNSGASRIFAWVFTQDEGRFGCYLSGSRKETEKEQVARLAADQAEQKWREAAAKRDILERIRRAATSLPEGELLAAWRKGRKA
jgi:hypothetical protein